MSPPWHSRILQPSVPSSSSARWACGHSGEAARQAIAASVVDTSLKGIEGKLHKVLYRQELVTPEWVREEFAINNSPGAAEALAAIARYFADDVDNDVLDETALRKLTAATNALPLGEADEIVPLTIADELEAITGISPGTIPIGRSRAIFRERRRLQRRADRVPSRCRDRRAALWVSLSKTWLLSDTTALSRPVSWW